MKMTHGWKLLCGRTIDGNGGLMGAAALQQQQLIGGSATGPETTDQG